MIQLVKSEPRFATVKLFVILVTPLKQQRSLNDLRSGEAVPERHYLKYL